MQEERHVYVCVCAYHLGATSAAAATQSWPKADTSRQQPAFAVSTVLAVCASWVKVNHRLGAYLDCVCVQLLASKQFWRKTRLGLHLQQWR